MNSFFTFFTTGSKYKNNRLNKNCKFFLSYPLHCLQTVLRVNDTDFVSPLYKVSKLTLEKEKRKYFYFDKKNFFLIYFNGITFYSPFD